MRLTPRQRKHENYGLAFVGSERLGPSGEAAQAKLRSEGGAEDSEA